MITITPIITHLVKFPRLPIPIVFEVPPDKDVFVWAKWKFPNDYDRIVNKVESITSIKRHKI